MDSSQQDRSSITRREFIAGAMISGAVGLAAAVDKKAAASEFLPGSDWPMYRHDSALSGASPIKGGLVEAPRMLWSVDLGGPHVPSESIVVADTTGEGRDNFLALSADSVVCRDARGHVLWTLDNFLNPTISDILDFAGDGSRGILLSTNRSGKIDTYMVNGRTGNAVQLWVDENNFGGHRRVGKLLSDVAGVQIAATASGQTPPALHGGDVRLVSFEEGLDHPKFRIRHHVTGVFYSPLILLADLDGDDNDEMVVVSHEQIWAFDPKDGRQRFYTSYGPTIRTYMATIAAIKLRPDDRCPALVMINPSLPGLKAITQDGATFARELWRAVIGEKEDQYQHLITIVPAGSHLMYDLENDGHYGVFTSIKNEHGDGETHLVIFDASTGKRLAELPDGQILAVDDLDGDGRGEILLQRGSELHVCRWQSGELQTLWQHRDVQPLLRALPREGDLRLTSGGSALAKGNSSVWRESVDSTTFLLRFPDGVFSCRLDDQGLKKEQEIKTHAALGNDPPVPTPSERVVWDGVKLVTLVDGREVYRYDPPAPTTYLAPPPLVADLDGKRRVLVRDSKGNYLLCSANGNKERVFFERSYDTAELICDGAGIGPMACDVDGDGDNEVVATVTDAQGRPACIIFDAAGQEKLRLELPTGMTKMNRGPTGRLGPGRGRWILLRMSGESSDHERQFVVAAYDGQTGKQLWQRNHFGSYGPNPVSFVAHFPSAVMDYDNDGSDDWLVCSENFYGIIDVAENRNLVDPVVLSDAVAGHWTAYTFPAVAELRRGDPPVVLHQGAYSLSLVTDLQGVPLWHFGMTRDTAGKWGQLVDLDGDGRAELLHVQPDGVIRCFSPIAPTRCPTCPADSPLASGNETAQRWRFDAGRPVSRMIAADLDADGRIEVLFGGDDGKLHALGERDGNAKILWSVSMGRRVGEPVLADVDGDGQPEILVSAEDGKLYCLKGGGRL